jgi:hypothetical protein
MQKYHLSRRLTGPSTYDYITISEADLIIDTISRSSSAMFNASGITRTKYYGSLQIETVCGQRGRALRLNSKLQKAKQNASNEDRHLMGKSIYFLCGVSAEPPLAFLPGPCAVVKTDVSTSAVTFPPP